MFFQLVPGGFLKYDQSEKLEFRLEKILGFRNMQEKLENGGTAKLYTGTYFR